MKVGYEFGFWIMNLILRWYWFTKVYYLSAQDSQLKRQIISSYNTTFFQTIQIIVISFVYNTLQKDWQELGPMVTRFPHHLADC